MLKRHCLVVLGIWMLWSSAAVAAEAVNLDSLLDEMTNRASLASFPEPAYTCHQASSYEPASKSADQPGWFANNDRSFFIRKETNGDRTEWVMMDAEGPGAIVRWWITAGKYVGTVRVYLDGAAEPAIETRVDKLVGGGELAGPPLSEENARGRNLYLPIPYAKHCKVTFDRNAQISHKNQDLLYYQINYRTYAPGTTVESFSKARLDAAKDKIAAVEKTLREPVPFVPNDTVGKTKDITIIPPGRKMTIIQFKSSNSHAVYKLSVRLEAKDPVQALRSTVLVMECDDEQTIWCPVGDFFGSGVGVNPFKCWYRQVEKDGTMTCWWIMPFQKECEIKLKNLGQQNVTVTAVAATCPWTWTDRSMHFHATWRQQRDIETARDGRKAFDWNYLTANGQGVFVGDTLTLLNRSPAWWGEGDEKIYVDGETFPSHFGTGTEDYYGYAWCTPEFFESPFHAQPRAEGPDNFGNTTNTRVRSLDAIPFEKSFRFDMEVWHWAKTTVDYAVTTYWYGRPGAKPTVSPMPEEARQPVSYHTPLRIPGFNVLSRTAGSVELQNMKVFGAGKWIDDNHLWWRGAKPGDKLDLAVSSEVAGPCRIELKLTNAPDYGIVQFHVDGKKVGEPVDLYGPAVAPAASIALGPLELTLGEHKLTVEIVGANPKAKKDYMVGIDRIKIVPAE
ncbi:MAG TPA: glycoside hydrolase family 172 protein [Thermoguttaceae bacterium]|nr:glycoside hydrolase family 172 protein [Thermoguttaceae bacterium]